MRAVATRGLVGVGYEGRTLSEFLDGLVSEGVARLVDVRLTPISRKPGFSKTALSQALVEVGIAYEHRRELGNPKPNRAGFAGGEEELSRARAAFVEWISRPVALQAIDNLAELAKQERVAVLCFEADQARCHRDVVLAEVAERVLTARGSRPPVR